MEMSVHNHMFFNTTNIEKGGMVAFGSLVEGKASFNIKLTPLDLFLAGIVEPRDETVNEHHKLFELLPQKSHHTFWEQASHAVHV